MGEHIPIADKVDAEITAFGKLWRKRRWLAVALVIGLFVCLGWTLYSNWVQGKQIDKLETANSRLESSLREAERENRGLRETVAPLLARAAREFPGEEINASLKKLLERLDADRPSNKPLASASVTVKVVIDSSTQENSHYTGDGSGGYAALGKGADALFVASANDSIVNSVGTNEVQYLGVFQMRADDKMVGKALHELAEAEYLQVEFQHMAENRNVRGGEAILVLNGGIRIAFDIPPQSSQGRRIFIRDVQNKLRNLLK